MVMPMVNYDHTMEFSGMKQNRFVIDFCIHLSKLIIIAIESHHLMKLALMLCRNYGN